MSGVFIILASLTVLSAMAAVSLRNLVHCALALTVAFAGLAALYLQLSAQFVGFAQILVYVGAVAILIVFAILFTRGSEPAGGTFLSSSWYINGGVAVAVFLLLAYIICSSKVLARGVPPAPQTTVRQIGDQLMTRYVLPLEVLGLLLTAALIGAVIIAMRDGPREIKPSATIAPGAAPPGTNEPMQRGSGRGSQESPRERTAPTGTAAVGISPEEGKP